MIEVAWTVLFRGLHLSGRTQEVSFWNVSKQRVHPEEGHDGKSRFTFMLKEVRMQEQLLGKSRVGELSHEIVTASITRLQAIWLAGVITVRALACVL